MKQSKLISLLKSFSSSELRAFKDFLSSPYFNKKEINLELYKILKLLAKQDFPEEKIKREVLFCKLFPNEKYDERKLNHVISEVFRLAEQYLGIQEFEQDRALPYLYTARAHLKKQQEKAYLHQARKARKKLEEASYRDCQYFYQSTILEELEEQHFSSKKIHRTNTNLQLAANQFDRYYLAQKLQYSCIMLDRQKFLPIQYDIPFLPLIKKMLELQSFESEPSIIVYHYLMLALTQKSDKASFEQFRNYLSEHLSVFTETEARQLFLLAINFCVHKIRIGERDYAAELMHFYSEGIEKGLLLEKGKLSPWIYKNVVKLGLGLQRLEWVESFVKKYSHYLTEVLRKDAYHFSLADIHFHKKAYGNALSELNKVEFSDIHYNLDAKAMLLKIYFESGETEALLSLISSFKIFLKRQKSLTPHVRLSYLNFTTILYKIYKQGNLYEEEIKKEIKNTKALNGRNWLLDQIQTNPHKDI